MENFGQIKDTFNSILSESIIKKDNEGKKIFKEYLKILKENNSLRSQYLIFKNLEFKKFEFASDAKEYIKENIELLKKLDKTELEKGKKDLLSLLENKNLVKDNSTLYDHINILSTTVKSASSLDKLQQSINYIKDRMTTKEEVVENKEEAINVPPSVLTKMATNRFNLKYADITEGEKEIIKTVLNGNDEDKKNIYETLKVECIDIIDKRLTEEIDLDLKDKILKVKDKLLRMTYNPDEYVKDINSVYELKNSVATEE